LLLLLFSCLVCCSHPSIHHSLAFHPSHLPALPSLYLCVRRVVCLLCPSDIPPPQNHKTHYPG
jgi:hypothetical protein